MFACEPGYSAGAGDDLGSFMTHNLIPYLEANKKLGFPEILDNWTFEKMNVNRGPIYYNLPLFYPAKYRWKQMKKVQAKKLNEIK